MSFWVTDVESVKRYLLQLHHAATVATLIRRYYVAIAHHRDPRLLWCGHLFCLQEKERVPTFFCLNNGPTIVVLLYVWNLKYYLFASLFQSSFCPRLRTYTLPWDKSSLCIPDHNLPLFQISSRSVHLFWCDWVTNSQTFAFIVLVRFKEKLLNGYINASAIIN